jgi:hypothetical protein
MQQKSERRQRTKRDTKQPLVLPAQESCEDIGRLVSARRIVVQKKEVRVLITFLSEWRKLCQ